MTPGIRAAMIGTPCKLSCAFGSVLLLDLCSAWELQALKDPTYIYIYVYMYANYL